MNKTLEAIYNGTLDIHPDNEEAYLGLEQYFVQVDHTMGAEFGQKLRDAEFALFQAESLSYFTQDFRLAVGLLLGG